MGIKVNVNPCEEIESMEQRKSSKLKDGTPIELITAFVTCLGCGQQFSFTYYEVD